MTTRGGALGRRIAVNTGALATANLVRIVVSFLIQLLIARWLSLSVLGQYTVAMAYLNISQVLCELGLPLWIVRQVAHRPDLRRAYWRRALVLQLLAAGLVWLVLSALVSALPYPPTTRQAIFLVGMSLPFFAVTSSVGTIFQAAERLDLLLAVEAITNGLILLVSIFIVARGGTVADLLWVVVGAQLISLVVALILLARSRLFAPAQTSISLSLWQMTQAAGSFFGLALADTLLQRLDILLLSLLGDPRLVGLYSAAYNLVRVGVKLVQSVWRALYPTLARLYQDAPTQADRLGQDTLRFGLIITVALAAVTVGIAGDLLQLVYGGRGAGIDGASANSVEGAMTLAWLIWVLPLLVIQIYVSTQLVLTGQARAALSITTVVILFVAVLLPLLARWQGAPGAAWGTLLAHAAGTLIGVWLARTVTQFPARLVRLLPLLLLALLLSIWLPAVWWLRAAVALISFLLGLPLFNLISRQDWQTTRKILYRSPE